MAFGYPIRVARIDPATNRVTLVRGLPEGAAWGFDVLLAASGQNLWAIARDGSRFVRLDERTGEVVARVRAVLRRGSGEPRAPLEFGDLVIDPVRREVSRGGEVVRTTRKEFDLLLALAQRAGEVVSKRDLLAEVWRQPYGGGDRTVDVHLSWLRRKLGESAAEPRYLHSTRGVGVRLAAPAGV